MDKVSNVGDGGFGESENLGAPHVNRWQMRRSYSGIKIKAYSCLSTEDRCTQSGSYATHPARSPRKVVPWVEIKVEYPYRSALSGFRNLVSVA